MKFYHFTDSRNLPSIRKYGLLSWKRLIQKNIIHWPSSSEDSRRLDARLNLEDYVRLSTCREHPMAAKALFEGRIQDYVWLEVSDEVIRWKTTLYSNDNAVANRTTINNNPRTALESHSKQAEILVLGGLNVKYITFPEINSELIDVEAWLTKAIEILRKVTDHQHVSSIESMCTQKAIAALKECEILKADKYYTARQAAYTIWDLWRNIDWDSDE